MPRAKNLNVHITRYLRVEYKKLGRSVEDIKKKRGAKSKVQVEDLKKRKGEEGSEWVKKL